MANARMPALRIFGWVANPSSNLNHTHPHPRRTSEDRAVGVGAWASASRRTYNADRRGASRYSGESTPMHNADTAKTVDSLFVAWGHSLIIREFMCQPLS